jgi:hypothetical protein
MTNKMVVPVSFPQRNWIFQNSIQSNESDVARCCSTKLEIHTQLSEVSCLVDVNGNYVTKLPSVRHSKSCLSRQNLHQSTGQHVAAVECLAQNLITWPSTRNAGRCAGNVVDVHVAIVDSSNKCRRHPLICSLDQATPTSCMIIETNRKRRAEFQLSARTFEVRPLTVGIGTTSGRKDLNTDECSNEIEVRHSNIRSNYASIIYYHSD